MIINGEEVENASYYFFDKDASVPIAYKSVVHKGPGKGQTITTLLSDYQEVDGLFAPFSMVMKVEENIMSVIKMEEAKFNVAIEDTIFTFPSGQ